MSPDCTVTNSEMALLKAVVVLEHCKEEHRIRTLEKAGLWPKVETNVKYLQPLASDVSELSL